MEKDRFTFGSAGLILDLEKAFARNGWTPELVKKLCAGSMLTDVRKILTGELEMVVRNVIDCTANPFVPDGWAIEEHRKGGLLKWSPEKIKLFLSERQKGGSISGIELRAELAGKAVLSANVLDYLLANPHLIPEEWKGKYVFFWGTIYRNSAGYLDVRCLRWDGGWWYWDYVCLGHNFSVNNPAALLAALLAS